MKPVRVAVVGVGHLGTYHTEKMSVIMNADLVAVCDPSLEKAAELAQKYSCKAFANYQELVGKVEAVLIAAPTPKHFEIAQFFLSNGVSNGAGRCVFTC